MAAIALPRSGYVIHWLRLPSAPRGMTGRAQVRGGDSRVTEGRRAPCREALMADVARSRSRDVPNRLHLRVFRQIRAAVTR